MFKLTLVTPEKRVVTDLEIESITVPANKGELNILPGHAPLITTLGTGVLEYKLKGGKSDKIAVSWGYCQVSAEGVKVLAESLSSKDEINESDEVSAIEEAYQRLTHETLSDDEYSAEITKIQRSQAKIDLLN